MTHHRDSRPVAFAGVTRGPFVLHEGLPHQAFERDQFARERARADVIELAGWPFYRDPIGVDADTATALAECASAAETFVAFGGEKRCGGFHPDFALSWGPAMVLLCFGCGEALLVDGGPAIRVDLRSPVFRTLLGAIRRNRPPYGIARPARRSR